MLTALFLSIALLAPRGEAQEPDPESPPDSVAEQTPSTSASGEALRGRIHGLRMSLLFGGDKVRKAEDEAAGFYDGKVRLVEGRLDTIEADLSEQRATYDLLLKRALEVEGARERAQAMREASQLRAEIAALERESSDLENKRGKLNDLIVAIDERDRDRERLAAQIETSDVLQFEFGLPLAGVGLAPNLPPEQAPSPLDDDALVRDLMSVDPRGAREVLFEMDPVGYWRRFPLRPPSEGVVAALGFPLPDLESRR